MTRQERPGAMNTGPDADARAAPLAASSIAHQVSGVNDQLRRLLAHLHRGGAWSYWWTNPGRRSYWWPVNAPTSPPPEEHNVYFGVHPTNAAKDANHRAENNDIAAISCLFADIDAKDFEGSKAAALAHVDGLTPAPSVVINSGGGYHCYWLLREPYLLTTPTKRERARSVQAGWVALVGGDPGAKDLARVLRVPGTPNLKYPERPLVFVVRADFEQLYDIDELESLLPAKPPRTPRTPAHPRRATPRAHDDDVARAARALKRLSQARCDGYESWYRVGMALSELGNAGLNLWQNWSQQSTKYKDGDCEAKWPTFARDHGLTLASVFHWADLDDPRTVETHTHEQTRPSAEMGQDPLPVAALRTDAGNGDRLVAEHGDELRYCHPWASWLAWDGRRWARDHDDAAGRCAEATIRNLYRKAAEAPTNDEARQWGGWATSSLSQHRIRAMLEAARRKLPIAPADLDADPWVLNVKNGILDLRTGKLGPHDPGAYITKLAPVDYDPDARLELWDRFLAEATGGDAELAAWLQKAVGYTLTGSTAEEVLFFVHGPAATGKSTFLEAIRATLGDYAKTADFETFLQRRHVGGPRPDIARLAGARFVPSIEVAKGKRLAEGLVKVLTGGDTVTARELYTREFEYRPAFKLWLAANDAPNMDASDEALWRRILRVPFEVEIPKSRRDPAVKATLSDPDTAGAAILAWAVQGCLTWQRERLGECPAVTTATADLRAGMDRLRDFLVDCCILDASAWTATAALREVYDDWCKENGESAIGGRDWSERLRANGCTSRREYVAGKRTRGWAGVGLLTSDD